MDENLHFMQIIMSHGANYNKYTSSVAILQGYGYGKWKKKTIVLK